MKAHPQNENMVHRLVESGELEIEANGTVWMVGKRRGDRWRGGNRVIPCDRKRAETVNPQGYGQVRALLDGKRYWASAHRLVWLHFNGPIPQGITINHKNGQKMDNRPENLELATYSEQRKHAIRELDAKHWDCRGANHPKTTLTDADVRRMRELRAAGMMVKDIAAEYGMRKRAVSAICTRRTWPHVN